MASEYAPTVIDGKMCIWLQSFGWHAAKPLGEVAIGDVLVYNFGSTGTVTGVERSKSGATVMLTVEEQGKLYQSRARRASTLVAVRGA
jgi:hypothetical protein